MSGTRSNREEKSFDWRLATYVAGAGAVLSIADTGDAAIIHSGTQNVPIGVGQPSYSLDVDANATPDYSFYPNSISATQTQLKVNSSAVNPLPPNGVTTSATPGQPLNAGQDVVSATFANATFIELAEIDSASTPAGSGPFYGVSDKYIGLQFDAAGATRYGWVHLSVSGGTDHTTGPTGILHDWAYETTGASLLTGQVPEPTGLSLLALGATGVLARRRRSGQAATA